MRREEAAANRNHLWWLLTLFGVSFFLYAEIARFSPHFGYETSLADRPLFRIVTLFTVAFVVYIIAIPIATSANSDGWLIALIFLTSIAFRLQLVSSTPIQEIDIYRYLWDGAVVAEGVNPFKYSPDQVLLAARDQTLPSDLEAIIKLKDQSPELQTILHRLKSHFGYLPTIYPPVSQVFFGIAGYFSSNSDSVAERITKMKIMFCLFDLATLVIVVRLLKIAGRPLGLSLTYGWCPLLMKEVANSGHLDAIAVFFTTLGIYLVAKSFTEEKGWKTRLAPLPIALAIGAKIYPVILIPVLFTVYLRKFGLQLACQVSAMVILSSAVILFPMSPWAKTTYDPIRRITADNQGQAVAEFESMKPSDGLQAFVSHWEINDFVFLVVFENLRPLERVRPWFSFLGSNLRFVDAHDAFLATRVFCTIVFLTVVLWICRSVAHSTIDTWVESCFLTIAWFWLLCPTQNPWYWTWCLPMLGFARAITWRFMAGLVFLYYLRFWFQYHANEPSYWSSVYAGASYFDFVMTWIEYFPWFIALFFEQYLRPKNDSLIQ